MTPCGLRSFICHYDGGWVVKYIKYVGGELFFLNNVNDDEFCYLIKDVEEKFGVKWGKIHGLWDGCIHVKIVMLT